MGKALIVIDMQPDFCPGGRLAVAGGDEIVAPINDLMADFDAVVLTQDWHPHDHMSFAENHPGAAAFSVIDMPYGPQVLWPSHCVIGTPGAAFHPSLAVDCADMVIRKGFRPAIDSYSAFRESLVTIRDELGDDKGSLLDPVIARVDGILSTLQALHDRLDTAASNLENGVDSAEEDHAAFLAALVAGTILYLLAACRLTTTGLPLKSLLRFAWRLQSWGWFVFAGTSQS